jgi:hypothetical protein
LGHARTFCHWPWRYCSDGFWLYLLLAFAFGFAAPGAERRALKRRGHTAIGHSFAANEDLARLAVLEKRP